jgi:NAD(P)-dependent dehydrogenase (short-subunit alcohol dehydrogenase family)
MNRLEGKVAVITGAGSGIGRAAAKLFVAEGAKVVVAEIDATLGEAAAREAGAGARFVHTDVTDEESVKRMVQHGRDAFGRIDVQIPFQRMERICCCGYAQEILSGEEAL